MTKALEDLRKLAEAKLAKARVTLEIDDYDRRLLAKCPAAVFVCNRLLPGLDEWVLLSLLTAQFETVKILHPYPIPLPKSLRLAVLRSPSNQLEGRFLNLNFAKKVARTVRKGGAVGLALDFSDYLFGDLAKNLLRPQILKQLRKTGQPIVPIHLSAERLPGGLLRRVIPGLPTLFSHEPVHLHIRIGSPIHPDDIARLPKTRLWGKFLQAKIFALGSPVKVKHEFFSLPAAPAATPEPLAEPVSNELIAADIAALGAEQKIATRGPFDVYVAPFASLPNAMFEIGRLRELTFRAAGEGVGKARDLDEHDLYYLQLVIWDREAGRIVGGYRLGQGDLIFKRFGVHGFYTSTLFKMAPEFFPVLQEAVELGRTYVVPDYQRHRLPLFLLWKGILHFLLANPKYRYLLGPVSISKYYSEVSKSVMVAFITRHFFDKKLAKLVQPRKPFRLKTGAVNTLLLAENLRGEFEALENFVADIEPSHFSVPVLFRQYLKQNARFVAFNVDPKFSDCLDGLMLLDVRQLPKSTIDALQQEK